MRVLSIPALLLLLAAPPATAQRSDADLRSAIGRAEADPTPQNLLAASNAARLMRDFEASDDYLNQAWQTSGPMFNGLINNTLSQQVSSGGGVAGAQRAFRELQSTFHFGPIQISNIAGNFPEILASGEYDEMILRLSPDAEDPQYRCACYNTQAWVHRLAGRHDEARAIWATLVEGQIEAVNDAPNKDAEANTRGQYARNLARAGQTAEARRQLEISMNTEVSDAALPGVRRRWAQAFAELGDVEGVVEHLEALLQMNSPITIHTLESHVAWDGVRNDAAFQAMLDRHR